ncbi:MAG: DoxX family membrane protein [Alphaproteobacteria bacterium]|nr:DoxX family membrane protein [Alphaproteobacteria bacterium]
MKTVMTFYNKLTRISDVTLWPLTDLAIRLFMANIFFKGGWLKFENYLNGRWEDTVTAFSEYHPIPGIDPNIAAGAGTGGEIVLPVLLALGLFTRFSAAGLLVMTLVIQFVVPADYGVANTDHYMWMLLLAVPFFKGPSFISLDFLIGKFLCGHCCKKTDNNSKDQAEEAS